LQPRDQARLEDVREHADELLRRLGDTELDAYLEDRGLQRITERLMEILGEAAGQVSDDARAAIEHDWEGLCGLRNILAHQYGRVDQARLFAATRRIRQLLEALDSLAD